MNKAFAKIISIIFHPLLIPLISVVIILNSQSYLAYTTTSSIKYFIYGLIFISTYFIPSVAAILLWKKGLISSLEMPERKERLIPFIITLICYIGSIYIMIKLPISLIYSIIVFGGALVVLSALLISLKWKISIHMIGIGGLLGLICGYSFLYEIPFLKYIMVISIIAGMVGSARLILKAHSSAQVYSGFLVGFFVEIIYMTVIINYYLKGYL
jgi:hypothetical protein